LTAGKPYERLHILVSIEIGDVGNQVFLYAVLAIGTTDTTLLYTSVETLDGLEVLSVDVCLTKLQFAAGLGGDVQILGEDA